MKFMIDFLFLTKSLSRLRERNKKEKKRNEHYFCEERKNKSAFEFMESYRFKSISIVAE